MIHGTNEHMKIDSFKRMIDFYARLIATSAGKGWRREVSGGETGFEPATSCSQSRRHRAATPDYWSAP